VARIERVSSTQPVPVRQAQLIDPGAFRLNAASAEELEVIGGVLSELGERKIEMQDRIGISNINAAMENAQREYQKEILTVPVEEHLSVLQKHRTNAMAAASQQKLSAGMRKFADNKIGIWADKFADDAELAQIKLIERDALIRVTDDYERALTEGSQEDIIEAEAFFDAQAKTSYTPAEAKVQKEKIEKRAVAQMEINAISAVHEAIETASDPETGTGNFAIATELAKSPLIPEPKQSTLRSAIKAARTARTNKLEEQREAAITKVNSDTIREYFNNELTVATLNERHAKGFIKDSDFKFMMTALTKKVPDDSDPFAAGRIRRAMASFKMGAIKRSEADSIILKDYPLLDGPDRSMVITDLEDIEEKIIAASKSNAYSEGRSLMSQRFVGIQSEEELIDIFKGAGLTDEQKKEINRQWRAEVNNRNLYERAVDDRFKEMRKEGISDVDRFKSESLKILLQYQRRVLLGLEKFEEAVSEEQRGIIRKKGLGFLGEIPIVFSDSSVGVATEFSIGVRIDGKETEIPTLVPTLTQSEFNIMVNDIIPNRKEAKEIPDSIVKKATAHAKKRIKAGQSPFAQKGEQKARSITIKPVSEMTTAEKQAELQRIRELKKLK